MKLTDIPITQISLKSSSFNLLKKILLIVFAASTVISFFQFQADSHHFMFSYLFAFIFLATLTLGSLFFVMIQHLTRAGWSVVVRRIPEHFSSMIPLVAILGIPILLGSYDLYHWTHLKDVAKDPLLQGKYPYLNEAFFVFRYFFFFAIWFFISRYFVNQSIKQDDYQNHQITFSLQKAATFCMIIFALTQSFAFIDWVMSLTPHWYSTIFGVYFFAGSCVVALALMSLVYMSLKKAGYLQNLVSVEHFHDIGKLLYGFNIFWAYIAFSQFFLIWYANVPEETVWYAKHFEGNWSSVATLLVVGHFAVPFLLFMSRHAKRILPIHCGIAIWLVLMHIVDLYWIIMPTASPAAFHLSIADVSVFLSLTSIYFYFFLNKLSKAYLIPVNDPRLIESLKFHNI